MKEIKSIKEELRAASKAYSELGRLMDRLYYKILNMERKLDEKV